MKRVASYFFIVIMFLTVVFLLTGLKLFVGKQSKLTDLDQRMASKPTISYSDTFATHLPVTIIETNGQQIEKDSDTWAEIYILNGENKIKYLNDPPDFSEAATIKYRGNSSYLVFDKKQYRIEFKETYGKEKSKNYSVMGMSAASDWVLNGPFLDRSLIRNRLVYSISKEILSWAPDTRYTELFLNGDYQGLYLMIEPPTNEEGRLNLTNFGLISGQTAYVLKRDRPYTEENEINSYGKIKGETSYQLSISYPAPSHLTETQYHWIENDINEFERVLYSSNFDDPVYGYSAFIDVDSFVDYYIINELTLTTDAGYMSTLVYKDIEGKLKTTVWDFNNSFNNYQTEVKSFDKFYVVKANWYDRLFQDRKFTDAVIIRYRELRKGVLSEGNLLRLVDENVNYLGSAVDRNFEKWGYTFREKLLSSDAQGNSRDPESYKEAVDQLKKCIVLRGNFMDNNIELLYQYANN